MNISHETLKRIEKQLDRLEGCHPLVAHEDCRHREAWLIAGFRPAAHGDLWEHNDGRLVPYTMILSTFPDRKES